MKGVRPLLLGTIAAVVLLLLAAGVAFSTSFQTWAARRALASRPGWGVTVNSVSAGLHRTEVRDVRIAREGAVLHLPRIEADVPVISSGWERRVRVTRLVAKGWTLDLSKAAAGPAAAGAPVDAAVRAFAGVLQPLVLPLDLAIDAVELEGEVILPEARGRARVAIRGGGLGVGREARFEFAADAILRDEDVAALQVRSEIAATIDPSPRAVRVAATVETVASGRRFPRGFRVRADFAAVRSPAGESYVATMIAEGREVLAVAAEFARDAKRLAGSWKLNLSDSDLVSLALGRPLPALTAAGQGRFEGDAGREAIDLSGRLIATAGRLETIRPDLAALGELHLEADFDLSERGGIIGVRKFVSALSATRPVATLRGLQAFEFNPRTGEVHAADGTRQFLGIEVQGLPITWATAIFKDIEIFGGDLRGEWVVAPRVGGGFALRSIVPAAVDQVDLAWAGRRVAEKLDVRFSAFGDYSPHGWQVEINGGAVSRGEASLLTLEAKAGQLAGKNQAVKATGKISANLPVLLAQPMAAGWATLTSGNAVIGFAATLSGNAELQATVGFSHLETTEGDRRIELPAVSLELRTDVGADGTMTFNAPVVIERGGRKSDLSLSGNVGPRVDGGRTMETLVRSARLTWEDARPLAAALTAHPTGEETLPVAPPWAGWNGSLKLQLKHIEGPAGLNVGNVTGLVRVDAGGVRLEAGQAGLGEGGHASASGVITFDASSSQPYAVAGDVVIKDFDPGTLWPDREGGQRRIVEGRFDAAGRLTAQASRLSDLASAAGGQLHVTSRGGLFRGLPVSVTPTVDSSSRLAGLFASAGSMLGGLTGRKEEPAIANRPEALAELVRSLYPLAYDQLSLTWSRDPAGRTALRNFTLIAPEFRVTGGGMAWPQPGGHVLDAVLLMEFQLRARGRPGELLKYLGVLEVPPDDLGYRACTLPLSVSGTIGHPEAGAVNSRLAALAVDKGGLPDKAAELSNRIRATGK